MAALTPARGSSARTAPPEAWPPLLRVARLAGRPLERFLRIEAASGILLLLAAALALVWANSRWASQYFALWHLPIGVRLGSWQFQRPLEWFVNDVLMVIFFFVVGLEIRREIHQGELAEWRRAALPAGAALGGMLAPAAVYLSFASAGPIRSGWGVPMATDIAFAVGILALLGPRVPPALRVLLLALAVIDDLGAIVVIALFYSGGVSFAGLGVAVLGLLGIRALQRFGVRTKLAYLAPASVVWAGIYAAGVHPTIAGVLVGIMTPVRAWLGQRGFIEGLQRELAPLLELDAPASLSAHELAPRLRQVNVARREALSPAESLIESLHPWVAFGIMPLFALANAGVALSSTELGGEGSRIALGIGLGLLLGKPIGILLSCAGMLRIGLGVLPAGITWRHLTVLGLVAGVGFTMALFVAQLAFGDPVLLDAAKLSVLSASGAAGVVSLAIGRLLLPKSVAVGAANSADEAERSTEV